MAPIVPDGFSVDLTRGHWRATCDRCDWESTPGLPEEGQLGVDRAIAEAEEHLQAHEPPGAQPSA